MENTVAHNRFPLRVSPQPSIETEENLPDAKRSESHTETKWDRQVRVLKENFGPSTVVALISALIAAASIVVTILIFLTTVSGKQGDTNGGNREAIDNLRAAVKDNKEEQQKALTDAVKEIKAMVKQGLDMAEQNQIEMRAMRASTDGAFVELRQDTKGLWKWATAIDGRVGVLEAEIKQKKEK